jgi:hypothetical protein
LLRSRPYRDGAGPKTGGFQINIDLFTAGAEKFSRPFQDCIPDGKLGVKRMAGAGRGAAVGFDPCLSGQMLKL